MYSINIYKQGAHLSLGINVSSQCLVSMSPALLWKSVAPIDNHVKTRGVRTRIRSQVQIRPLELADLAFATVGRENLELVHES
jgi:hypothetical protein